MTSPVFTPIFLARSPTLTMSETFTTRLLALGTVISVFLCSFPGRALFFLGTRPRPRPERNSPFSSVENLLLFDHPLLGPDPFSCSLLLPRSGYRLFPIFFAALALNRPLHSGRIRLDFYLRCFRCLFGLDSRIPLQINAAQDLGSPQGDSMLTSSAGLSFSTRASGGSVETPSDSTSV